MKLFNRIAAGAILSGILASAFVFPANADTRLKISGQHAIDHPATITLKKIAAELEAAGVGLSAKVFPANQLGDYTLVYEDLIKGSIDIAHISVPSQLNPKLEANFFPYLVSSYEEMRRIYSPGSCFYGAYNEMQTKLGVKLMGITPEGFIGVALAKPAKDYMTAGADKGVLIRVPPIETFSFGAEAMGFRGTTIAYADLYPALQTGVADGWIGGTASLNYHSFSDVVKEYIPYNAYVEATAYVMSKMTWDKLDDKQQAIVAKVFSAAAKEAVASAETEDTKYLAKLSEKGIKVHDFSGPKADAFIAAVRAKVWPQLEVKFGADLVACLKSDVE